MKIIDCLLKVIFAIFHFGFITNYFSDNVIAGFTTGAAIHVIVRQLNLALGITVKNPQTPFKLVEVYVYQ